MSDGTVDQKIQILEECAKAIDDLYQRGPLIAPLPTAAWSQAWGSGVLDASSVVRGMILVLKGIK